MKLFRQTFCPLLVTATLLLAAGCGDTKTAPTVMPKPTLDGNKNVKERAKNAPDGAVEMNK